VFVTEIKPIDLLNLIRKEELDELNRVVYNGTRRYVELVEPRLLTVGLSGDYNLKFTGAGSGESYFSFVGVKGRVLADILIGLPNEMLRVTGDETFMGHVREAEQNPLIMASIPLDWIGARQMNQGLYEGAAQFDVKPPCLRLGAACSPKEMVGVIEDFAKAYGNLRRYQFAREA